MNQKDQSHDHDHGHDHPHAAISQSGRPGYYEIMETAVRTTATSGDLSS